MLAAEVPVGAGAARFIAPHDFVAEVPPPENSVHQAFDISVRRVVNMQVDAAVIPQNTPHFHQPHAQPTQKRRHILPGRNPRRLNHRPHAGPVVADGIHPFVVNIRLPAPAVGKTSPLGQRVRRGVKIPVLVKRRIGGNELHRAAVHPPQKFQIIAVIQRPVGKVRRGVPHTKILHFNPGLIPSPPAILPGININRQPPFPPC